MRRGLAAVVAGMILAACGSGQDPTIDAPRSSTTASTTTSTVSVPTTAFEGGTTEVSTPPTETALLDQVTVGRHDGFDRVVFRFTNRVPGYRIGPTKPPITEDGSGNPVTVKGLALLEVAMSASGFDSSVPEGRQVYNGPRRVSGAGSIVNEVVRTGDFEAVLTWVIGLYPPKAPGASGPPPASPYFRVTTVSNPPRLIVDIRSS